MVLATVSTAVGRGLGSGRGTAPVAISVIPVAGAATNSADPEVCAGAVGVSAEASTLMGGVGSTWTGSARSAAAELIGLGIEMVGGEMYARMNKVTPAMQASTGKVTAKTEIHPRAGLRSTIRLRRTIFRRA